MKTENIIDNIYGRLKVKEEADRHIQPNGKRIRMFLCLCECGNEKSYRLYQLLSDRVKSCGCFQREQTSKARKTHGECKTVEYRCWYHMKTRCYNKNANRYKNYGGRGIKVCDRWLHSYENFLADMGRKPTQKHSIDRIDVNGNYESNNCRWATTKEQGENTTTNVYYYFNGEKKTITQIAQNVGMDRKVLWARVNKQKLSLEQAVINKLR
jgi:hypothetical protein